MAMGMNAVETYLEHLQVTHASGAAVEEASGYGALANLLNGYQVLKKWLSYREQARWGRPLTLAEARELTQTARRLAALLLLQPELDENYRRVTAAPHPWKPRAAALE